MAKITVAGSAVVITSSVSLENLKKIKKYRPDALVLKNEEKEPIFMVGVTESNLGTIGKFGAEFGAASHDEEALATITMVKDVDGGGNICDIIADEIGVAILNLNKVEETLPAVLAEIDEQKAQILSNITIA